MEHNVDILNSAISSTNNTICVVFSIVKAIWFINKSMELT